MSMFKIPLNRISNIETNISNLTEVTTQQSENISSIQKELTQIPIELINEKILIIDGVITLSKKPLSNKVINNYVLIVEEVDTDLIVQAEIVKEYNIENNVLQLETNTFNGYYALISYIYQGEILP